MRFRNTIVSLAFLSICLVVAVSSAQANALTDAIQKRYESIQHFQADFQQELTNAASGSVEKRSGKIWFKQPALVRWDTQKPEKELLVVGQSAVWNYSEIDKVAIRYRTNQVFSANKSIIRIMSGKANLNEDYKVSEQGSEFGLLKLRLVPKEPEQSLALAYIWVDPKTHIMNRVLVIDFYQNGNLVILHNLVTDKKPDAKLFDFTPPSGVQVRDNTKQQ